MNEHTRISQQAYFQLSDLFQSQLTTNWKHYRVAIQFCRTQKTLKSQISISCNFWTPVN